MPRLITHHGLTKSTFDASQLKKELENKHITFLPLDEQLALLDQLREFELGRFLLANKRLNGYWTSYIIIHGLKKEKLHPLERWILYHAPSVKATQERFKIFQKILQDKLEDGMQFISVPCGTMDDFTLDYSEIKEIHLTGIDLDAISLELAQENAKNHHLTHVNFQDAWNLDIHEEYDILMSNGLNIYEFDDDKVTDLYKQFSKVLKPSGILIASFLTPPPTLSKESTWKNINTEDALKQKTIFSDIINAAWQVFRTEAETLNS
ncbi:methyltransferase domain-containing protein [Rickettsia helvetica]|uniref:Methyltranfer-dom domain-containing protein n=1 Tax=Rickettsia helvetica TaxID=35789 RepID=A0ABM9NC01_RICHE|nr:methyltransferase domain-containing protein [Rickettsia helvetica]